MGNKNLSRQVVESNSGAGLPVGFTGGPVAVSAPLVVRCPYVLFVSPKGQTFSKIAQQIPDLQDGDPVLVQGDQYTRLNPFRFYLVNAFQHFSKVDGQGQITETTLDVDEAKKDKEYKEHVECMIIVLHGDSLIPATCTFKTTKTNAAHRAIEDMKAAENPEEWAKKSAEHKASAVVPVPYARFITTVTLKRGTGKKSGFAFVAANAFTKPSGISDWQTLAEFFKDAEKKKLCEEVWMRFQDRIEDVKAGV